MNGFTFKNVHSSIFNISFRTDSRTLMPLLRRTTLTIGGRSGSYDYSDAVYDERSESITCYFARRGYPNTASQARQIAKWLSGTGALIFDDEPDVMYTATVTNSPSLKRRVQYGEFEVVFTYNPPFGEDLTNHQKTSLAATIPISLMVDSLGTVETPCKIRFIARSPIHSISITAKAETT